MACRYIYIYIYCGAYLVVERRTCFSDQYGFDIVRDIRDRQQIEVVASDETGGQSYDVACDMVESLLRREVAR